MVEIKTKACERCNKEFDIDTAYRTLYVEDHPHPNDIENIREEQSYTL